MWKRIIKSVKARGYTGADDDLDAIKAFIAEKGLNFETTDGTAVDLDKEVAAYKAKAATVIVEAETETTTEDDGGEQPASAGVKNTGGDSDTKAELLKLKADVAKLKAAPAASRAFRANLGGFSSPAVYDIHRARKSYEAKSFGKEQGQRKCHDFDAALNMGVLVKGLVVPDRLTADEMDIWRKTQTTTVFTASGALIPEEMSSSIIDLKEKYGVIRQLVGVTPMSRDQLTIPRRTSGLTVYAPGEAAAVTASDPAYDQVTLTANKFMTESKISAELFNDSAFNVGDLVTGEIAQAHALNEDTIAVAGDGALATYFGTFGFAGNATNPGGKFRKIHEDAGGTWGTNITYLSSIVEGAGAAFSNLTIGDFEAVCGRLPEYATQRGSPKWLVHKEFYWAHMRRLALAQGGSTAAEVIQGDMASPTFFGYPVVFSQVMPRTSAGDTVCAVFGAFELGAKFGEVRGSMEIKTSDQRYIESDIVAIYSKERIAFNFHDAGNYSSSAASRVVGPIIGLATA